MSEWEIEEAYRDWLDEVYGEVRIGNYTYLTSVALAQVDPIAYRVGLSEYENTLEEEDD